MSLEHSLVVHFEPHQLILICIIGPILLAVLGLFLLRKVIKPDTLRQYHDIAGPFLNTIGALYGIFLALIVASTWQFYSTTAGNVIEEARCLQSLYLDSEAFPPKFRDQVRPLMRTYRDALVTHGSHPLPLGGPAHRRGGHRLLLLPLRCQTTPCPRRDDRVAHRCRLPCPLHHREPRLPLHGTCCHRA